MITDVELGFANELKNLCKEKIAKDILDVVIEMMEYMPGDGFGTETADTDFAAEFAEKINNTVELATANNTFPKRKVGEYEILNSFDYGGKEIFLAEKRNEEPGAADKYMVGTCSFDGWFERYSDCVCGNSYNSIASLYSQRVSEQIAAHEEKVERFPYDRSIVGKDSCDSIQGVDLKGKVVVLKPIRIKPEYVGIDSQLCVVKSGFGCAPESRGSKIYCVNLYTGEEETWHRQDVLGTMKPECMPQWAVNKLEEIEKAGSVDGLINEASGRSAETGTVKDTKSDVDKEIGHD